MNKFLLIVFLSLFIPRTQAQSLSLPVYGIQIDPANLALMNANPHAEIYYPGSITVGANTYPCEVRYKGATSLSYAKKSWAVKFPNDQNPFNASRINLNADMKDYSFMRNFLVLSLFKRFGQIAPAASHISLKVNGQYYGVYQQIENIDEDLLQRFGRKDIDLYKAENHGAGCAALAKDKQYNNVWDERAGDDSYRDLRLFFNKLMYWTKADFDAGISNEVEIDNVLNYFAVHFALCGFDNFTKNQNLNRNSLSGKFEIIPWDNEGTFGNDAFGVYDTSHVSYNLNRSYTAEYNGLFQRLLENSTYKAQFISKLNNVLDVGFPYLDSLATATFDSIKADAYQDPQKECSNAQFDAQLLLIKNFMTARKAFLKSTPLPSRQALSGYYCSNPFPTAANQKIIFRVKSAVPQVVVLYYADSVSFNIFGKPFLLKFLELYDDGLHDDLMAGDLVYGGSLLSGTAMQSQLIPFCFTGNYQNFPANGLYYMDYYRSKSFAVNKGNWNDPNVENRTQFGRVFRQSAETFIEVVNTSATQSSDLSYCHIRGKKYYEDLMLLNNVVLGPGDTLIVSSDPNLAARIFPGKKISDNRIYFDINPGDTLRLLAPDLSPMLSRSLPSLDSIPQPPRELIVINEINYNSAPAHVTGDWVELYNPGSTAVDLSNWIFRDSDNGHNFVFPAGSVIAADGYLLICEDTTKFRQYNPVLNPIIGPIGFGMSNSGDMARIYNRYGYMIDSVKFNDKLPWSTEADGEGPTLELRNWQYNNEYYTSWYAYPNAYGTPGAKNHLTNVSARSPYQARQISIYPNPSKGQFFIDFAQAPGPLQLNLYNSMGQLLWQQGLEGTERVSELQLPAFGAGFYFLQISGAGFAQTQRIMIR